MRAAREDEDVILYSPCPRGGIARGGISMMDKVDNKAWNNAQA